MKATIEIDLKKGVWQVNVNISEDGQTQCLRGIVIDDGRPGAERIAQGIKDSSWALISHSLYLLTRMPHN